MLGTAARHELRDRLLRRFGRNLTTLGPAAHRGRGGGYLNRRATLKLAEEVRKDLAKRLPARSCHPAEPGRRGRHAAAASGADPGRRPVRAGWRVLTNQYGVGSAGSSRSTRTPPGIHGRWITNASGSAPDPSRSRRASASSTVTPRDHRQRQPGVVHPQLAVGRPRPGSGSAPATPGHGQHGSDDVRQRGAQGDAPIASSAASRPRRRAPAGQAHHGTVSRSR